MDILKRRTRLTYRLLSTFIAFTFSFTSVLPPAYAQSIGALNLPAPGTMVSVTPGFTPIHISGITVNPENPLQFDFIINPGDTHFNGEELKAESEKLIKYFLASLTVPEEELWVNLSPYEKDRIVAKGFGDTVMGRDMLAQDYILKQLTASMMYPEKELGKKFWDRVYQKARERFGSAEIPMNTFNKIWIMPDEAVVYQQGLSAFVIKSRLKVMLEEDYLALQKNLTGEVPASAKGAKADAKVVSGISSEIVREILVPEIEKEVNEGKTFANLRQIYNSLILATWYKTNLKESLLGKIYVNQNKTKGIDTQDKQTNEKIYKQYVESFKKGVYNYIREDQDPVTREVTPRKYFSGGVNAVYNPVKRMWLSAIIDAALLRAQPNLPTRPDVAAVISKRELVLITARMAEKQEEATVITLKASEQISTPGLVNTGASVELGNALIEGDVRIDNRSGQPVVLERKLREFFPTTKEGRPLIQDAAITIVNTEKEAQQLASSPITQEGKGGRILRNLVFAVVMGTLTCFGAGCGRDPSGSSGPSTEQPDSGDNTSTEQPDSGDNTGTEQPSSGDNTGTEQPGSGDNTGTEQPGSGSQDQVVDMSTRTITELREFLHDSLWENQRNAAIEIYARYERQTATLTNVDLARTLLVINRIAALTSPDPDATINSAEYQQLLELGAIAKDPLKKQLENESADINTRKWSEQLLEEIIDDILRQYDEILPSLRTVLQNLNSRIYDFALEKVRSLIYRHPLALSTGIALLKDPVAGVRIVAANTLADLGFESAIVPIGNARAVERDPKAIAALDNATTVLLQIVNMGSWSLEDLNAALTSPYWSIQKIAIQLVLDRGNPEDQALAVAQIQKQIVQLTSPDENTRNTSPYIHLLELGDDAIAPLRANVENTFANIIRREWSLDLLTKLLPYQDAFVLLESILKDPAHLLYPFTINSLTRLILAQADPLALNTGIALLKDPLAGVRIAAANALEDIGRESAIIPLGNARALESDPKVIAALDSATNILLQNANMTSWPLEDLKAALASPYWSIQKIAIQLVLDKGNQEDRALAFTQIQKQIAQLTSPDVNTPNTSPYLHLLELGSDAVDPLRANVENTAANIVTRQWSLDLLTQLLSYQSVFPVFESILRDSVNPLYSFTIDRLTKLVLTQTNLLALGLELLNSQVSGVRIVAIGALGQTRKIEAIAPLENIIATSANPAEVTAAKNALGVLYRNVDLTNLDLTTWNRTTLIAELDNSTFWVMQKRAAQELFRRNDTEGIALARSKLVMPRINVLGYSWTDSPAYLELAELGYIIIDPFLTTLTTIKNAPNSETVIYLAGILLGTIGEFDHVVDGFAAVTEANGYNWRQVGDIQTGLNLLYARQTPEFLATVLNDTNRLLYLRMLAALHLGNKQDIGAIDDLEKQRALTTDANFITTIDTALSQILASMTVGTYAAVFDKLVNNVLIHPEYSIYSAGIEELKKLILANQGMDNVWGLLSHNVVGVRTGAVKALGEINDPRVFIPLKTALSDPEKLVRFYAAEALGKQEKAAYLPDLVALREREQDPEVVVSAEKAIVRISIANDMVISLTNQQLMVGMQVDNLPTKIVAAQEIFVRGDRQLIAQVQENEVWKWVNQMNTTHVPAQIALYGDISVPPLIDKASGKRWTNTDAVKWAARLLGSLGQFKEVFELLQHIVYWGNLHPANQIYDWWHAVEAERGLAELYAKQSVESWMEILRNYEYKKGPNPGGYGRAHAALYLGYKKDPLAIDLLMDKTVNDVVNVRYQAVWALGETGNTRALTVLEERLASGMETDPNVIAQLEIAIAKIKASIAKMDVLVIDLESQDKAIKLNALKMLGERGDPYALSAIEGVADSDVDIMYERQRGIALITDGRDMIRWSDADLMKALSDNSWPVVKNVLIKILGRVDMAPDVKKAAFEKINEKMSSLTSYTFDTANNNITYRNLQSLGNNIYLMITAHIRDQAADPRSRRWMMCLLGDVGDFIGAYQTFEEIFQNADGAYGEWAQGMGINGLTRLFERQSTALVASYLSNDLDPVQIAAAKALGAKGDTAALPALQAVAGDTTENPEVIDAAQEAIAQINAASSPIIATSSPVTEQAQEKKVGGIDFNPALLNLQIKRDSRGVPLPLPQQPVNHIHIDGLIPVIINIVPVPNLPLLLGLSDAIPDGNTVTNINDPSKAREPENLSLLN